VPVDPGSVVDEGSGWPGGSSIVVLCRCRARMYEQVKKNRRSFAPVARSAVGSRGRIPIPLDGLVMAWIVTMNEAVASCHIQDGGKHNAGDAACAWAPLSLRTGVRERAGFCRR